MKTPKAALRMATGRDRIGTMTSAHTSLGDVLGQCTLVRSPIPVAPKKGYSLVVRSLSKLMKRFSDMRLTLVWEAPEESNLTALTQESLGWRIG